MVQDKKTSVRQRIRNDLILGASLIALALVFWIVTSHLRHDGAKVTVLIDGKEVESYSLSDDVSRWIETEDGKNLLFIRDGKAFIAEADCPDLICARHKGISKDGETIVCLPHRLVVRVGR